jgi:cell division protein FtsB
MVLPDYQNVDSWWQWFKRRPLWLRIVVILVIATLATLFAWQYLSKRSLALENTRLEGDKASLVAENQQLRTDKDSLAQELDTTRTREAELHRENLHQKELLDPIRRKAEQLYPALETDAAVAKLAEDMKQVRDLATRDLYRPLAPNIRERVVTDLRTLRERYSEINLKVSVVPDQGIQLRTAVAGELASVLREAGYDATAAEPRATITNSPLPVRITMNPEDLGLAQELSRVIGGFIDTRFSGITDDKREKGTFIIWIAGDPLFSADGVVTFR